MSQPASPSLNRRNGRVKSVGRGSCTVGRGPVSVAAALLCMSVVMLLCSSGPALAARGHVVGNPFGSASTTPADPEPLSGPLGVAVNEVKGPQEGDVYVVDRAANRVERFSAGGVYLGQFDGSGKFEVEGHEEEGTAAGFGGQPGEIETGQFSNPSEIAIDNSSSATDPSKGDVYLIAGDEPDRQVRPNRSVHRAAHRNDPRDLAANRQLWLPRLDRRRGGGSQRAGVAVLWSIWWAGWRQRFYR